MFHKVEFYILSPKKKNLYNFMGKICFKVYISTSSNMNIYLQNVNIIIHNCLQFMDTYPYFKMCV